MTDRGASSRSADSAHGGVRLIAAAGVADDRHPRIVVTMIGSTCSSRASPSASWHAG